MIEVTMYKTEFDGRVHETQHAARTHAEKQYNENAQQIADAILDEKSSSRIALAAWIKQNLDRFVRLQRMRDDIQLRDTTVPS